MKKCFCQIASLVGLFPLLSLTAVGAQEGDFVYQTSGGGAVVTAYVGPGGNVVIPDTLGGLPVKAIGDWGATAFGYLTNVTSVIIPNGVTNIGPYAFAECTGLTNVVIPSSVTHIQYFAFDGCSTLTSVTLPNGITTIEQETFSRCTSLKNVTLPNGLNSFQYRAFSGCTALTSIAIPDGVTVIFNAFDGCSGLTNITIPDSATYVGSFAGCTNLTAIEVSALNPAYSSVDGVLFDKAQTRLVACPGRKAGSYAVPNTVTNIGLNAFADCIFLTNIAIPSSVTTMYEPPFFGCTGLIAIHMDALNPKFSSVDGVVFNKAQTHLTIYPGGKAGSYVVPNSVTSLGWRAFDGCIRLTSITIPNSVNDVGFSVFSGCTGLTNVSLPNTLTQLGDLMFRGCTSLKSITIPNSVNDIANGAFANCAGLTSITIPNSVPRLNSGTFAGCRSLTNVIVGNNVTVIGDAAFIGCTDLTRITIPASVNTIGESAFADCTALTSLYCEGNAPSWYEESTLFDGSPFVTVFYRSGTTGWGATYADRPTVLWGALSVQHSGTNVIVSWPKAATDFVLEESTALGPLPAPAWTQVPAATYQTNVTSIFVTQPAATGHKFYRLRRP